MAFFLIMGLNKPSGRGVQGQTVCRAEGGHPGDVQVEVRALLRAEDAALRDEGAEGPHIQDPGGKHCQGTVRYST